MKPFYALPIVLLIHFGSASFAQIPQAYADRLQFVLDSVCEARNIKGASAAVSVPDVGVWEGVYGESHAGTPIGPEMFLGLGSNTKTYVAAALLKLQEQELIDLDDTVGTWIQHPNIDGEITIRQLLNHTSGLYSYTSSAAWGNAVFTDLEQLWNPDDLLQYIGAPMFEPGASWDYSNTNYLVAGLIVQEVTGQLLGDVLSATILDPAGLDSTVLYAAGTQDLAIPHIWSDALSAQGNLEDLITDYAYDHNSVMTAAWAAGGMMATAKDNALFWSQLVSGELMSNASWSEMTDVVPINSNTAYGLGIFRLSNFNGATVYSHGGTNLGFINENIGDINTGVGISALTNQDSIGNSIVLNSVVRELHRVNMEEFTGIAEVAVASFSIFPNPAADVLYIDLRAAGDTSGLAIHDLTGKMIISRSVAPGMQQVMVNDLSAGAYVVEVRSGYTRSVQRLLIAR